MSRMGFPYGWLLYAGHAGGSDIALAGDCLCLEINVEQSIYARRSVRLSADMGDAKLIQGKPESEAMWEALQSWPEPGKPGGRRWSPQLRAMAGLARRYPDMYRMLLEAELAAEPLKVVPDAWLQRGLC